MSEEFLLLSGGVVDIQQHLILILQVPFEVLLDICDVEWINMVSQVWISGYLSWFVSLCWSRYSLQIILKDLI